MADITFTPVGTLSSGSYAGDFNWNTTANWQPAQIPAAGDDVFFGTVSSADAYSTVDDIANDTIGNLSVGEFVRLFVGIGDSLTVANVIANAGDIEVDNGATLTVASGGNAAGRAYDLFHGSMFDPGDVSGPGATFQFTSGTLEIGGSFVGSQFDTLSSPFADHNLLIFDAPPASTIPNQIAGVLAGDRIELGGVLFNAANYSGTKLTLTSGGNPVYTLTDVTLASGTSTSQFLFGTDGATSSDFIQFAPLCFLRGTLIATEVGETPIENLVIGDQVRTASGRLRAVRWVGVGKILATRGRRTAATPVIVRKGAIEDNLPHRDLRITKSHSLYIDGVLIPVEFLVNHRSIIWDDRAQEVTLYHLELETHDVILANGAPAETYRDDGNRWLFQNANSGWHLPRQEACAAVLTGGCTIDTVWRRLLERAGPRPGFPLTGDSDLHLLVDGKRLDAASVENGCYRFRLFAASRDVRIASRAAAPSELGLSPDPRPLGVAVKSVVLLQGAHRHTIEASDGALRDGFHNYEHNEGIRWTTGDARLPIYAYKESAPIDIEVMTAGAACYVDEGVRRAA